LLWKLTLKANLKVIFAATLIALLTAAGLTFMGDKSRATEWRPGTPLAKERLKIGVIHVSDVKNTLSGYAYAHDIGINAARTELGLKYDQIIRKFNVSDTNFAATEHAMRECVMAGVNVIIATSWNHMGICEKLAKEYPGVLFAHGSGIRRNETNFTNYFGRIYQPRYLSGIVAGMKTVTGKIGYVAAMGKDNSEVTSGLNAFALGVESVNPNARVYVKVTHRWYDPPGEKAAAQALIEKGCDVIAQHTNTPAPQIEAQSAGVWGVGYNSDMKNEAPNAVLTSVVWNWGVYYARLMNSVVDGSFNTAPYLGDLDDGIVGLTPLDESLSPPGAAEAVAAMEKRIRRGEFDVFEGVMETDDGRFVGREGARLSYEEISSAVNWYYRNVIEL
jgi:basic membrane protein A